MSTNAIAMLGRVALGAIFIWSGTTKLAAPTGTIEYIASSGMPFPHLAFWAAVLVEVGGAAALILGIAPRLAAGVLALFCLATAIAFHGAIGDQDQLIHFLKNVSMAGGLLQVAAFGAAGWTVEAALASRRGIRQPARV